MKNRIKILGGCLAVVIIITVILVPVVMAFTNALNYYAGFETNANYNDYKTRAWIRVTGGNGNWIFYYAESTSNMGYLSTVTGYTTAESGSFYGNWVSTDCTDYPLVTGYSGIAYYKSPFN